MGIFVDEYCDVSGASVYKNYSCTLSQANIEKNANKFYIMQIVTNGTDFWLYYRYGRIGDKGVVSKTLYRPVFQAIQKFCSTFYSKTGNKWGSTPFQNKKGKYIVMDIEEPELVSGAEHAELVSAEKLAPQVDDLIKMISDKQLMTKTLKKLNVDVKKLPLGKIKKEQLTKAEQILSMIRLYLASDSTEQLKMFGMQNPEDFLKERLIELSSTFWTLLPYSCGRNRPPAIDSIEVLEDCAEKLDGVRSIAISTKIIERGTSPEQIYESLHANIQAIDRESKEWKMLLAYVNSSQGTTHDKTTMLEAYTIDKNYKNRVDAFSKTKNHILLFHGSRSANFVGILSEGLRIPNAGQIINGSVLGTGIYFADCVTKSFNYCHDTTGLVLVCEVALGKSERILRATSHPLSQDYQSRMALGKYQPSPAGTKKWERDPTVIIPCGKLDTVAEAADSGFWYNEYVIYDKDLYRFRYLLKLKIDRAI